MKNFSIFFLGLSLFLFSCKKEQLNQNRLSTEAKKYAIKFNVSEFSQTVQPLSFKPMSENKISATDSLNDYVEQLIYMVYNSDGEELKRLVQDQTGYGLIYTSNGSIEEYTSEFGHILDSLAAGNYTIVMIAGPSNTFGLNWYEANDYSENFRPLNEAGFEYAGGLDNWSRATETFFKKFTITVNQESAEQDVTLDRIVGKIQINLTDQIPENADHFRFYFNGEKIGFAFKNEIPSDAGVDDEEFAPSIAINENQKGETGYAFCQYIINTVDPINVVINCYDASNNLIASKTIEDVQCHKNKQTILTGKLFDTVESAGFNVSVNADWSADIEHVAF